MSASCILTSISFILLIGTICAQLIAFLTSHMIDNHFDYTVHEGIYQRCGSPFGHYMHSNLGAMFGMTPKCNWWNSRVFDFDPIALKIVAILGFISFSNLGFVFFLGLLSLADRLRTKGLQILLGILMILNGTLFSTASKKSL